jgi:hypothetical protein
MPSPFCFLYANHINWLFWWPKTPCLYYFLCLPLENVLTNSCLPPPPSQLHFPPPPLLFAPLVAHPSQFKMRIRCPSTSPKTRCVRCWLRQVTWEGSVAAGGGHPSPRHRRRKVVLPTARCIKMQRCRRSTAAAAFNTIEKPLAQPTSTKVLLFLLLPPSKYMLYCPPPTPEPRPQTAP